MIAYQLDNAFYIVCLANPGDSLCSFQMQPQRWKRQSIVEYCGVVTGEAILGANIFRDFSPAFGISSADVPARVYEKERCVKRA